MSWNYKTNNLITKVTKEKRTDADHMQVMCWLLSYPSVVADHQGSQKARHQL